jgi:hypothetical protein
MWDCIDIFFIDLINCLLQTFVVHFERFAWFLLFSLICGCIFAVSSLLVNLPEWSFLFYQDATANYFLKGAFLLHQSQFPILLSDWEYVILQWMEFNFGLITYSVSLQLASLIVNLLLSCVIEAFSFAFVDTLRHRLYISSIKLCSCFFWPFSIGFCLTSFREGTLLLILQRDVCSSWLWGFTVSFLCFSSWNPFMFLILQFF